MSPPLTTASAASSVKPPANTPRRFEDLAARVLEEVVRPVDRLPQRLVTLDGGAAAAGEEPEPFVEAGRDLRRRHHARASGGELDRQWDAVEPRGRSVRPQASVAASSSNRPPASWARSAKQLRPTRWTGRASARSSAARRGARVLRGSSTSTRIPGHDRTISSTIRAAAAITCSQLSSTTRSSFSRSASTTLSAIVMPCRGWIDERAGDDVGQSRRDHSSGPSSTSQAPSRKRGRSSAATWIARRASSRHHRLR